MDMGGLSEFADEPSTNAWLLGFDLERVVSNNDKNGSRNVIVIAGPNDSNLDVSSEVSGERDVSVLGDATEALAAASARRMDVQ
jgi:hypothetical protein